MHRNTNLGLPLLLLLASGCHDSSSGSNPQEPLAFLNNEARVNTNPPGTGSSNDPTICVEGERIYAVWEDHRNDERELYFNASDDGGRSWRPSDVRIPGSRLSQLATGGLSCRNGVVTVAWAETGTGGCEIRVNTSTDGGRTWLPDAVRLDPGDGESRSPRCARDGDNVYVIWDDALSGERDVYLSRSTDRGVTWSPAVRMDTDPAGAARSENHEICADGDDVYVVWTDYRNGLADVYLNHSADGGATWLTDDRRVNTNGPGTSTSRLPEFTCRGASVQVTWLDDREGFTALYFNLSVDRGASFEPNDLRLNDPDLGSASDPEIVRAGARVYVVWEARDDIYLNYSVDGGSTWLPAEIRLNSDPPSPQGGGES